MTDELQMGTLPDLVIEHHWHHFDPGFEPMLRSIYLGRSISTPLEPYRGDARDVAQRAGYSGA